MSKDDGKQVAKEALKEWLDEKFAEFGRWSFKTISAIVFTALMYFVLRMSGWAPTIEQVPSSQLQAPKPTQTLH